MPDLPRPPPPVFPGAAGQAALRAPDRTLVMGILNVTPDSFSDGGQAFTPQAAVLKGLQLAAEGADIIDVGGESTRPGAAPVPVEEELRRVLPVIKDLAGRVKVPLSVDTSKAEVAAQALAAGARMVNDITALADPRMAQVLAEGQAAVVLMHMLGAPADMQEEPFYINLVEEIKNFLADRMGAARQAGIPRDRIILDPGLGFGKTVEHNLEIMDRLEEFLALGAPLLVGPSRKSFIGKVLNLATADRLEGTLACVAAAVLKGARLVRVHDVKPAVRVARMADAILRRRPAAQPRGRR